MDKKALNKKWKQKSANILKAELVKRGLNYNDLQKLLQKAGIDQSIGTIRVKASRGCFASAFFLQCLYVIGAKTLNLSEYFLD